MERARRLKPWRAALAVLALAAAVAALLAAAARAPHSAPGALVAGGSGMAIAALVLANANFLLPLADWLFGTLRLPGPGADLFAAGRAMAPRAVQAVNPS